jgi:Uma2 family endonuclease
LEKAGIVAPSPRTKFHKGQIYDPANQENHQFTTDEYHRITELGILPPDVRTELLDGRIYEMSPIGKRHGACVDRLTDLFKSLYSKDKVGVRCQNPIVKPNNSEPVPDISLVKAREDYYRESLPTPRDVFLLVEVSDSTIDDDNEEKAKLYAKAGITELWIIDLGGDRLLVKRDPTSSGYADEKEYTSGRIAAVGLPGVDINIDDLLIDCVKRSIRRSDPKGSRKR